jgi:hypothetical protein
MEQNNNKEKFSYSYSAKEREEINKTRQKYAAEDDSKSESKLERLRRLDAEVARKGTVFSLTFGIISTLILGFGMSLIMTDIGEALGILGIAAIIVGIVIGIVGAVGVVLAYPLYKYIEEKERARIAPEIIKLSDELIK